MIFNKKEEAIKRMKKIGFKFETIDLFKEKNIILMSKNDILTNEISKEILDKIEIIKQKYNIFPYHYIETKMDNTTLVSVLYVSDEVDEWEYDLDDINHNYICCYILNIADDLCSEFGYISYKKINGVLKRIT